jgi:GDP/UDP-N,N'-diacetylbacillosamine 2-epimerase (hydrolysing)
MPRKIAVITGTRAEYGLLFWLMRELQNAQDAELQLIVTGAHLSQAHGYTVKQIKADGFPISSQVDIKLNDDSPVGIAASMSICTAEMAQTFERLQPDIVVILGDRYEMLATASAALIMGIPIAHIHGGEATEGAVDESIRHAITKMSQLHFTSTDTYRNRVIQLGENSGNVYNFGAPGVEAIKRTKLLSREELEKSLGFALGKKNLLVTFHPVTLESEESGEQMQQLLTALAGLSDTQVIFTLPNADAGNSGLVAMIHDFAKTHQFIHVFSSLGQQRYLSSMQFVDAVVGNSSSGIIEAPSFKKPTINIGNRQQGRIKSVSVIDCEPVTKAISAALEKVYSPEFQATLKTVKNPYEGSDTSKKIVDILLSTDLKNIQKKRFFDIPVK